LLLTAGVILAQINLDFEAGGTVRAFRRPRLWIRTDRASGNFRNG
jgi:hypothetical protein